MEGAAGAGSLVLEFSVLSRLTGDPRFEVCEPMCLNVLYLMSSVRLIWHIWQYGISALDMIW